MITPKRNNNLFFIRKFTHKLQKTGGTLYKKREKDIFRYFLRTDHIKRVAYFIPAPLYARSESICLLRIFDYQIIDIF